MTPEQQRNYGQILLRGENVAADCPDCGALVWNEKKHDEWHDSLDMLTANVYLRRPEVTPRIKQRAEELARERGWMTEKQQGAATQSGAPDG